MPSTAYLAFVDPVTLDPGTAVRRRFFPRQVDEISADFGDFRNTGCRRRVWKTKDFRLVEKVGDEWLFSILTERGFGFDGVGSFQRRTHSVFVDCHHSEQILLPVGEALNRKRRVFAKRIYQNPMIQRNVSPFDDVVSYF